MKRCLAVLVFISLAAAIAAQDNACPTLQTEALNNIVSRCGSQAAGTLCLGHPTVTAIQRSPNSQAQPRNSPAIPCRSPAWTGWP